MKFPKIAKIKRFRKDIKFLGYFYRNKWRLRVQMKKKIVNFELKFEIYDQNHRSLKVWSLFDHFDKTAKNDYVAVVNIF